MAFTNRLQEITEKLQKIYINKKITLQSLNNLNVNFQQLRDVRFIDDCLTNFVTAIQQFCLILIEYSIHLNGNEKYIPIVRTCLHCILSVIDKHDLYRNVVRKSSTMLSKLLECPQETVSLKEIFKFYNLCLIKVDKNCINNFSTKHKITCLKLFNWINLAHDIELQYILTEILYRLTENNLDDFGFFTNTPELKKSFSSIDLQQPYKQIRGFLQLINNETKLIYSIICKQITIDGSIIQNVIVNNTTLPLYLDFNMIDHKITFLCKQNQINEIDEKPLNNLEMISFLCKDVLEVDTYFEGYENTFNINIKLKSSALNLIPNNKLNEFHNFIFTISDKSPNFQYFFEHIFSLVFPSQTRHLLLEESFNTSLFNNLTSNNNDNSMASTDSSSVFLVGSQQIDDFNEMGLGLNTSDNNLDKAISLTNNSMVSILSEIMDTNTSETEVMLEQNVNQVSVPQNKDTSLIQQDSEMSLTFKPSQPIESTTICGLDEENPTSKVKQWLKTNSHIVDESINDCNNNNNNETIIKLNIENDHHKDECISISDDENDVQTIVKNNDNLNKSNTLVLKLSNSNNNLDNSENNNNINKDNPEFDNTIVEVVEKHNNNTKECLNNKSQDRIENNKISYLESQINGIVNSDTELNCNNQVVEKQSSPKIHDQPLKTNDLIEILEDGENELPPRPITILSSNKTGPKKKQRRCVFNPKDSTFYECNSSQESTKDDNKVKKQEKKKTNQKSKEPSSSSKIKTKKIRKSKRQIKQTKFYGFKDDDLDESSKLKNSITNEVKSSSGSFFNSSKYEDFIRSCNLTEEPFVKLKESVRTAVAKRQSLTAIVEDSKENNDGDDDDEIVSPFKGTRRSRRQKRLISDSDELQPNISDNSRNSVKKIKATSNCDNSVNKIEATNNGLDKIQIISNIKLNAIVEPKKCSCIQKYLKKVSELTADLQEHHPELEGITKTIYELLK